MLLAIAGCNFFMDMPMGDDVMLDCQSWGFHDGATLRQVLGLRPAQELEAWLEQMDLWKNGRLSARAGNGSICG